MAYVLKLSDGTTTIDFLGTSGTAWCELADGGLLIGHPPEKDIWAGRTSATQGRRLTEKTYDNRKITIDFEIAGSTKSNLLNLQQDILQLLDVARDRQMYNTGYEVTLEYQVDTTSSSVKFVVVDGKLEPPTDFMSVEKQNWTKGSGYTIKDWRLELTCMPFAFGAETQIVTSDSVDNIHDDNDENYVSWSGSAINGDVPGPLRVRFTSSSAVTLNKMWVGLRDFGTPANFLHVLSAVEPGVGEPYYGEYSVSTSGGTPSGDTVTFSGWSGAPITWTITPNSGLDSKGKVRAVAVTGGVNFSDNTYYLSVENSNYGIIRTTPYVKTNSSRTIDLGVIDLDPSGLPPEYYGDDWQLKLYVADGTTSFSLRALLLFPAQDYKFRWYNPYIANTETFEDIGRHDITVNGTTARERIVNTKGFPLHAAPGKSARLYFTFGTTTALWSEAYTGTVNVWHTPYYLYVRGSG